MNGFKYIEKKYNSLLLFLDLTPDDYINEEIKELSGDIAKLKSIILDNKSNKELVSACEKLISKLNDCVEYFKSRLKCMVNSSDEEEGRF